MHALTQYPYFFTETTVVRCYFSLVAIKHHGKKQFLEGRIHLGLSSRGKVHNDWRGMKPSGYRRKVTSPSHKADSKLELERIYEPSKPIPSDMLPPARPDLLNSPSSTSNWGLSV